jgi:DNA repair ATPase RecN
MSEKMTAEEMLTEIGLFFLKKPKGLFIMIGSVAVIISILYFSSIRAQNSILIDSLKVLGSTAQISDTIVKKVKEIESKADQATATIDSASKDINERIQRLEEVEQRFLAKREEIRKLREEQDVLMKELAEKLDTANQKLDQIDAQQATQQKQQEQLMMIYKDNASRTGIQKEVMKK